MANSDIPIIVALIGLTASLLAQIITGFSNQQQARRKERYEYLRDVIRLLGEARAEIQWAQIVFYRNFQKNLKDQLEIDFQEMNKLEVFERLQIALGKAHAIMVSVNDDQVRQAGLQIMQEWQTDKQNQLIENALIRLGQMFSAYKYPEEHSSRLPK
jgi:hypothetical protein